ncbi:MAG: amidohydrolase [Candidatus Hodarchaeales archaeon]
MSLAITGGSALTMDPERPFIKNCTVIIEDNIISELGSTKEITIPTGTDVIKLNQYHVVLPGLINAHSHASMTLLRGYADDMELQEWLTTKIFPLEAQLKPADIYIGTQLACVESLLGGTTCINSMYHMMQNEAQAISDTGIRGMVGHVCFEWRQEHDLKETKSLASQWHGKADGRIRVSVDPHTPYTVGPEYMLKLKDLTEQLNKLYGEKGPIPIHIHLAETEHEEKNVINFLKENNIDPTDYQLESDSGIFTYLEKIGFFNNSPDSCLNITAAHCVSLRESDYSILSKFRDKITIVHCPVSNLKLGAGITPLPKILDYNISVGLGTDGTAANNSLNMFETMKFTALIHKGFHKRADIIKAGEVIRLATNGKSIHWENLGQLIPSNLADLIVVNMKKPHLMPVHDIKSHLVYSVMNSDVEYVICNGNLLIENNKYLNFDLDQLYEKVEDTKADILTRLN